MQYRSEVVSVTGFVQQIACSFLRHGYWFYVTGCIPADKDAKSVDRKLVEKYGIAMSESTRARRKQLGFANLQYICHDRFFAILATKGQHCFFDEEEAGIRDIRRIPLQFAGYSISYRRGGRTRAGERDHRWHPMSRLSEGGFSKSRLTSCTWPCIGRRTLWRWRFTISHSSPMRRCAGSFWSYFGR